MSGEISGPRSNCSPVLALVYVAMGASGIVGQALSSLTKDQLRLSASGAALFMALASIPTYLGPLYAFISDSIPLLGSRRRGYLILSGIVGACAWFLVGTRLGSAYSGALALLALALLAMQFSTAAANGLMVEEGRVSASTGRLQSIQWGAANAAAAITALCGGILLERFSRAATFRLYALFPLLSAAGAAMLLRSNGNPSRVGRGAILATVRDAACSRICWAPTIFLFAWFFSPGFGTALYFHQRDTLRFGPGLIGLLSAVFAAAGIPAAALYSRLSRGVPVTRLLTISVVLGTLGHLSYLAIVGPATAVLAFALDGAFSLFAMLSIFDLGARLAPARMEGTSFSVLTSARIVAYLAGGIVGGALYDTLGFRPLVLISSAFTASCGLLVPWLSATAREADYLALAEAPASS